MVLVDWAERQSESKVHDIRTLGWENDGVVNETFQRICKQVQPIMRKRGWVVPVLTEFYPAQTNLLGLNVGGGNGHTREIKIRARYASSKSRLIPEESLLGTLLHELVHNVQGPHDKVFYKLLDEITEECEELMAKGITGTGSGFDGPSSGRLGSHSFIPQHNPPEHRLRSLAAQAAEARAKKMRLMPGVRRLGSAGGGAIAWRDMTPAQAAAAAAERRAADDLWCPCGKLGRVTGAAAAQAAQQAGQPQQQPTSGTLGADARGAQAGPSQAPATAAPRPSASVGVKRGITQQQEQQAKGGSQVAAGPGPAAVSAAAQAAVMRAGVVGSSRQARSTSQDQPGGSGAHKMQAAAATRFVVDLTLDDDRAGAASGTAQQHREHATGALQTAVVIELNDDSDEEDQAVQGGGSGGGGGGGGGVQGQARHPQGSRAGIQQQWECPACTFLNTDMGGDSNASLGLRVCSMCLTPVPAA